MACRIFIFVLLFSGAWIARAETPLYVGEAAVDPGPPQAGAAGSVAQPPRAPILDALNQVLVRLTGRIGVDLVGELGIDVERAERLALGRQFREVEIIGPAGETVTQRRLRVDFDPLAVNRLLNSADLPRWGSERPELLLWMVGDGATGTDYLQPDAALRQTLDEVEFRYGLELARPILDASDRVEVTPADVRGGFTAASLPAVRRYGTDGVVMLDLRRSEAYWTGRWSWRIGDRELGFQRSAATPEDVVRLGLARIAESLARRFAVRSAAVERLVLEITGLDTMVRLREAERFLGGLTGVEQVRIVAANGDAVRFHVDSATDGLRRRIELTGPLAFERLDFDTGVLHYRFRL